MPNKHSVLANCGHQGNNIFANRHHFKLSVQLRQLTIGWNYLFIFTVMQYLKFLAGFHALSVFRHPNIYVCILKLSKMCSKDYFARTIYYCTLSSQVYSLFWEMSCNFQVCGCTLLQSMDSIVSYAALECFNIFRVRRQTSPKCFCTVLSGC